MLSEELFIYKDLKTFIIQLYKYQKNIKRDIRYGEYSKLLSMAHQALDLLYEANSNIECRRKTLSKILYIFNGMKNRIRIFGECKVISEKQQHYLIFQIDNVSKQAVGWRNKTI